MTRDELLADLPRNRPEPTTVVATQGGDSETVLIRDNYALVCDGSAHRSNVAIHHLRDGTQTHVITIKGVRP